MSASPIVPDAKLIELGRQFEAAKATARKLNQKRRKLFREYEQARQSARLPEFLLDWTQDNRKLERKIALETGYSAAADAFNSTLGECIRIMKAIHRTKATTLEGFAVKIAAVAFDQSDFELDEPATKDVAERMLYRLTKEMRKAVTK